MSWRKTIQQVGIKKIADAMGVKFPTVLKYTKDTIPKHKMRSLIDAMRQYLDDEAFIGFMNSLSEEVTKDLRG